jgi:hypothetical protein
VLKAIEVDYPAEERSVHAALKHYSEHRQARCHEHGEKFATDFVLMTFKKRLFSSLAAFLRSLEQHGRHSATPGKGSRSPGPPTASSRCRSNGSRKTTRSMTMPRR